eukprot:754710-Hanusia_phi.AAC.1
MAGEPEEGGQTEEQQAICRSARSRAARASAITEGTEPTTRPHTRSRAFKVQAKSSDKLLRGKYI